MDPNETLRLIRTHTAKALEAQGAEDAEREYREAATAFRELDQWLSTAGHLPTEWRKSCPA